MENRWFEIMQTFSGSWLVAAPECIAEAISIMLAAVFDLYSFFKAKQRGLV